MIDAKWSEHLVSFSVLCAAYFGFFFPLFCWWQNLNIPSWLKLAWFEPSNQAWLRRKRQGVKKHCEGKPGFTRRELEVSSTGVLIC